MEWQAGASGALEAKTDKWAAKIEQSSEYGFVYSIKPLDKEEPNVFGNGASIENCKVQVQAMMGVMDKWN